MADSNPADIFTEPPDVDPDTLANLGPLRALAGLWEGAKGRDVNPKAEGPERSPFIERIELQPIDPQANGPQLFYGLRYHTHILKPTEALTFHEQVGYWLWEPATGLILQSLAIPRGQVALAAGHAAPDAISFKLAAARGATDYGIASTTFLEEAFKTLSYEIEVSINGDGTWSYFEVTVLDVKGQGPFRHEDSNTLARIAPPRRNPLAEALANA
jgi:hypothetical protein